MRAHDWSTSPLGPPETWPQSLRSVVGLLLNSKFPMFVAWGRELGFLYNDAYAEILADKHPRALGARFSNIWSEIWPDIWPLVEAAMAGRAIYRENLPLTMNRKGFDEETWFTFSYSPVRDESGAVAGMFCAVEETTVQILTDRQLIASEARYRQLADELKEAQQATEALNATLEHRIEDALAERLKDQALLVEAQESLRQVQKMETIGQLTGGVAHDFNNLLTPIVGALDVLRRQTSGDERAQRLASGALQAADRARLMIQRLLAFSRRQHLEPRSVDIRRLVAGFADLVSRLLGPRVELTLDIADDLPRALVDPNQLELALLNLAVNGRDAMAGEGRLAIAVHARLVGDRPKLDAGSYISIAVSDTGTGMDDETLRRATEPFFTTKGIGRGTGLGLSSVLGLAEQSGGDFEIESFPGRGTTATLWLPLAAQSAAEIAAGGDSEIAPVRANAVPVLLVDDEQLVRAGTADMLAEAGYVVIQAGSGYEALRLLEDELEIEALISDFAMPGMNGLELAQGALALRPNLQVLLITGYANVAQSEAGGLARLAKPFRQADLAAAVAELLRDRKIVRLPRALAKSAS
ncbi:MAG TPA: ATP-binding protein [Stellaceae bacterium]|jgi:signal transduction histidine kinase/ActR/RegA family two-component response regulator